MYQHSGVTKRSAVVSWLINSCANIMEFLSKEMKKKMIQGLNAKVDQERKEAKAKAKEDAKAERIL